MMRRLHIPLFAVVLAVWVAGILLLDPLGLAGRAEPQRYGRRGAFRLEVCDEGREGPRSVAYRVADRATGDGYLLHWGGEERFLPGDAVDVAGVRFAAPEVLSDYDVYLLRHGLRGRIYARRWAATADGHGSLRPSLLNRLRRRACLARRWLTARLEASGLSERSLSVARGVLFGDTSALGGEVRADIRSAGMSHLMAVSGLHIGLLFALVMLLLHPLRWAGFGGGGVRLAALAATWAYVVLVGCPSSAVRAAVMLSASVVAWLRRGGTWGWHDLCLAAFLILLCDPQQLYDVGFQLSFLATAGILAFRPLWKRDPEEDASLRKNAVWKQSEPDEGGGLVPSRALCCRWSVRSRLRCLSRRLWEAVRGMFRFLRRKVAQLLCLSFAAQLLTFPVVAYVFHQVPLLGWLQGVVVAPLLPLYIMVLLVLIAFPSATWAAALADGCSRWMLAVAHATRAAEEWLLGGRLYWYPTALEAALMSLGLVACLVAWRARIPWLWLAAAAGLTAWLCMGFVGG